LLTFWI